MKYLAPEYYLEFKCIAGKCSHTCCKGWEIEVDEDSLPRFMACPDVEKHVELDPEPHIILDKDERCPFLQDDGLCRMILEHGEDFLCQICTDHPRFRNFWTTRTEIGLGMVCEEAARLILTRNEPMNLVEIGDDGFFDETPEDEQELLNFRDKMLLRRDLTGPKARLWEYLVYRHIADALYDDRLEARTCFVEKAFDEISGLWDATDGSLDAKVEVMLKWSYDNEYDDEKLEENIAQFE